ncbi:MAG: hypothetical protein HC927_03295 [Deltaproteobacteria bacterium]|nr:hypothetical protein [Deltaproteobacteria bacterium]
MAIDPSGRRGRDYRGRERDDLEEGESRYAKDPEVEDEALSLRMQEFRDWDDATIDNRENQQRDRDYYDGIQWTQEEVDDLNDRGQPVITKNRIAPKVNFILGEEMDSRVDPRAFPRTRHHDLESEAVTDALRYQAEADDFDAKRSEVAGDLFIEAARAAECSPVTPKAARSSSRTSPPTASTTTPTHGSRITRMRATPGSSPGCTATSSRRCIPTQQT